MKRLAAGRISQPSRGGARSGGGATVARRDDLADVALVPAAVVEIDDEAPILHGPDGDRPQVRGVFSAQGHTSPGEE